MNAIPERKKKSITGLHQNRSLYRIRHSRPRKSSDGKVQHNTGICTGAPGCGVPRAQNTAPTQDTRGVFPVPSRPFSRISIKHKGGGNGSQVIGLHNDRLNTSCILFEVNLLVTGRRAAHSQPPHKPSPCALTSPDLTRHSQ